MSELIIRASLLPRLRNADEAAARSQLFETCASLAHGYCLSRAPQDSDDDDESGIREDFTESDHLKFADPFSARISLTLMKE